jgi:hypothetical protein
MDSNRPLYKDPRVVAAIILAIGGIIAAMIGLQNCERTSTPLSEQKGEVHFLSEDLELDFEEEDSLYSHQITTVRVRADAVSGIPILVDDALLKSQSIEKKYFAEGIIPSIQLLGVKIVQPVLSEEIRSSYLELEFDTSALIISASYKINFSAYEGHQFGEAVITLYYLDRQEIIASDVVIRMQFR